MDKEAIAQRVLYLSQTEGLSGRQIAACMGISRRRVKNILNNSGARALPKKRLLDEYVHLVNHWYKQYPHLQATQVWERLKAYGYQGSYVSVARLTREHRRLKQTAYHPLTFLPGEEAQIDWFFFNHDRLGQVAGFVYVLAYSRYAWGVFYPKTSFEFFLAGHIECFKHIGGLAHRHRYDNLKSVVLKRSPLIEYNPQFVDFARVYGFAIHLCNPYKGNEKGRVERLIRDIRAFLYAEDFIDICDLNNKFHTWLNKRNGAIHRSTGKTPKELLCQERLIGLPQHPYLPRRVIQASTSKTALVEFETNKYSVPSRCALKTVEVMAYPESIEICLAGKPVARHKRSFGKKQIIQNPLHAERLLGRSPQFKMQRILQLITNMDPAFQSFIENQDDDTNHMETAYQLFTLLKTHSRPMLISAVRELKGMACFKIKALRSLLGLPEPKEPQALWPQNTTLLNLKYQERSLKDYDPNSRDMETA